MPCRSDYMDPHRGEVEIALVEDLLRELHTGEVKVTPPSRSKWYNRFDQRALDEQTDRLCAALRAKPASEIAEMSPRMITWWCEHMRVDLKRALRATDKGLADLQSRIYETCPIVTMLAGTRMHWSCPFCGADCTESSPADTRMHTLKHQSWCLWLQCKEDLGK